MVGLLDMLQGQGGGLLDFLRQNAGAAVANSPGGLPSDMANYGPAPMSFAPPPQAQVMPANQPNTIDSAPWPQGPVGAPMNANAAMPQQPAPMSMAGPQPAAPAPQPAPEAPTPSIGNRLAAGLSSIQNSSGLIPSIVNGIQGMATGSPVLSKKQQMIAAATGPDGRIDLQKLQQAELASGNFAEAKTISEMAGKDSTDLIKNFQFAQRNGFKGNLFDYEKQLKEAGATRVNTTVNGGEKAFDNAVGKDYGETFVGINKAARDSVGAINNLNILDQLSRNPNFYSGAGSDLVKRARQIAVGLGVADADKAAPMELFQKISQKTVLDAAGGSLGTGFSNADRDFLNGTVANLANTPEGNRQIIDIARKVETRKQEIATEARRYAASHGGRIDAGFDEYLQRWSTAHPLFPQGSSGPRSDYGTSGNAILDQAKAAIAQGAPRDAVIGRLRQSGVDPGDL